MENLKLNGLMAEWLREEQRVGAETPFMFVLKMRSWTEGRPDKEAERASQRLRRQTGPSCCSTSHHTQPREAPFVVVAG